MLTPCPVPSPHAPGVQGRTIDTALPLKGSQDSGCFWGNGWSGAGRQNWSCFWVGLSAEAVGTPQRAQAPELGAAQVGGLGVLGTGDRPLASTMGADLSWSLTLPVEMLKGGRGGGWGEAPAVKPRGHTGARPDPALCGGGCGPGRPLVEQVP